MSTADTSLDAGPSEPSPAASEPDAVLLLNALRSIYGALPIDSRTGQGSATGDIHAVDTLASFGRTMLAGVGVDPAVITSPITSGQVIGPALA